MQTLMMHISVMAGQIQLKCEQEVPHCEGVSTAKVVSFHPGTIEQWMNENNIFMVPVKYTLVCHAPALAVLDHTTLQ